MRKTTIFGFLVFLLVIFLLGALGGDRISRVTGASVSPMISIPYFFISGLLEVGKIGTDLPSAFSYLDRAASGQDYFSSRYYRKRSTALLLMEGLRFLAVIFLLLGAIKLAKKALKKKSINK
jgi:hypothetical protein